MCDAVTTLDMPVTITDTLMTAPVERLTTRVPEDHRVTHLKDTVKGKSYLVARNGTFLAEPFRYPHLHNCRSFIRFRRQSSLHQSPIRIKVMMVKH